MMRPAAARRVTVESALRDLLEPSEAMADMLAELAGDLKLSRDERASAFRRAVKVRAAIQRARATIQATAVMQ